MYRRETQERMKSSYFHPCHPDCEHCKPRAEHFEKIAVGLREKREAIIGALIAMDAGPCECGLRQGEHWAWDHK